MEKLIELSGELEARVAFDAVAGPATGLLCNAMPNETVVIVYGGLSNKLMTDINPMDIIFRRKSITGFSLPDWKKEICLAKYDLIAKELQQLILKKKLFTQIQDSVKFEEITQGLKTYLGNMSKGKMLIRP